MRSGVCGAVCRPACGAGKDSENKQPLLCESSSRACVRVSTAVGSSDAEGEGWGCRRHRGGRGVGAAETDWGAGAARRDGGRTLACSLLRQARGSACLPPGPWFPARRGRATVLAARRRGNWEPVRGGPRSAPTVAQAAGERQRGPAPLGLRRRGSRAGLAPGASVAGSPGKRRCAGKGARAWRRSIGRPPGGGLAGHVPAAAGPPEPAVTKPAHAPVRLRSRYSVL